MSNEVKITLEDEFGIHEFETNSDCICICDDGNGNISIIDDGDYIEDELLCNSCEGFCIETDECIYE